MDTSGGDGLPRDRHLFDPGPKRILALDGGGVRGVIAIAFLERIEAVLREQAGGKDVRLADHFDLIGGTSTGAIIGAALALGMSVSQVKTMYFDLAPNIFKSSWTRVRYVRARFDAAALNRELESIIGDRTLDTPDLLTGYCVVAKRMDTGSVWTISNNPRAPFWETLPGEYLGNRYYQLASLIRASTAAPTYFDPERLPIGDNQTAGLFVDGGVSPYNSPTIALLLHSQLAAFKLRWKVGSDNLKIVSIGTGTHRKRMPVKSKAATMLEKLRASFDVWSTMDIAINSLKSVIDDAQLQSLMLMQWLGDTPKEQRWWINAEALHMIEDRPPHHALCRFFRYDMRLERDWLMEWAGTEMSDHDLNRIREMDDIGMMERSYEMARKAASIQVRPQDWAWPAARE